MYSLDLFEKGSDGNLTVTLKEFVDGELFDEGWVSLNPLMIFFKIARRYAEKISVD